MHAPRGCGCIRIDDPPLVYRAAVASNGTAKACKAPPSSLRPGARVLAVGLVMLLLAVALFTVLPKAPPQEKRADAWAVKI